MATCGYRREPFARAERLAVAQAEARAQEAAARDEEAVMWAQAERDGEQRKVSGAADCCV